MSTKGIVLKIDRGSTHDGPGIRTVVFLKGCPLRCLWCSTPDSQEMKPQLLYFEKFCQRCGKCVAICPNEAIERADNEFYLNRKKCAGCGKCVSACLNNALRISGQEMSVDEIVKIVARQANFWRRMGGGITISGGEVFAQAEFATELLRKCHDMGFDTNIETSCNTSMEILEKMLPWLDHICCDIKHMDSEKHKLLTGVTNEAILRNIRHVSNKKDLILRYPVIPSCNDSHDNVEALSEFIKTLGDGFNRIDLLTYHQMGTITYKRLGKEYALSHIAPHGREKMKAICDKISAYGINATLA